MRALSALAHQRRNPAVDSAPRGRSRGAAAVETALVIPIFLLLFTGVADLGMGALQTSQATSGAADAARAGVVLAEPPDTANCATDRGYQRVISAARTRIPGRDLGCDHVRIECLNRAGDEINCASADTLNDRMRVTVTWTWEAFSPIGQAVPIQEIVGSSTMRFIPQPKPPTTTTFPIP